MAALVILDKNGYATSYPLEEILEETLLGILNRYVHLKVEEKTSGA